MMYLYVVIFASVTSVLGVAFSIVIKKVFGLDNYQSFNAVGFSLLLGIIALCGLQKQEDDHKTEESEKIERLKEFNEELSVQVGDQQMELSVLRDLENMSPHMKTCCMHVMSYGCMSSNILEIGEESIDLNDSE